MNDYYKNDVETPDNNSYIFHCINLVNKNNSNIIIIDPNIPLPYSKKIININDIENCDAVTKINRDNIKIMLTMRYDSYDENKEIIDMEFENNSNLDTW
jgi:hypothetical protein